MSLLKRKELEPFSTLDTTEYVHIEDIKIPPDFAYSHVRKFKIIRALQFYKKNGYFDKPITVIAEINERGYHNKLILIDGLSRYVAAKWMGIDLVPVKYIDINDYLK